MTTLLAKNIHTLATMDDDRRELHDAALFVRDNVVEAVGALADMPAQSADCVLDLRDHVVLPGLVNTHHHMFQTLTRVVAQELELFGWLRSLYPLWSRLDSAAVQVSARLAMSELLLSGCTTSSDHLYLYPNNVTLDDTILAARETGIRFHATRGAMSLGESRGGLPPDDLCEDEGAILHDMQRVIETFHDPLRHAMLRVALAPCSPFTVTDDLMRESASLARSAGVLLHTHLAENDYDVAYSLERYGLRPGDYAEALGWTGRDVWHAHCVKLNSDEIGLFARTGTGVCHCPASNLRLGSGIAPLREMMAAGLRVGLGVDGSASNDAGNLLNEARLAMLLQRAGGELAGVGARDVLELATRGGAALLGRDDIGCLAPGMAADFIAFRLDQPALAGAEQDALAALVFCMPPSVDLAVVNGRILVSEGQLVGQDLTPLVAQHRSAARRLWRDEGD